MPENTQRVSVGGFSFEKYITGGEFVQAGQPLYKIDSRQYESTLLSAQATLAQSQANYQNALATLQNAQVDNNRYQTLLSQNAISDQQAATQQSQVEALTASLHGEIQRRKEADGMHNAAVCGGKRWHVIQREG